MKENNTAHTKSCAQKSDCIREYGQSLYDSAIELGGVNETALQKKKTSRIFAPKAVYIFLMIGTCIWVAFATMMAIQDLTSFILIVANPIICTFYNISHNTMLIKKRTLPI